MSHCLPEQMRVGCSPALCLQGQAAGTGSQHCERQLESGLPAVPGVCSWEATGWLAVGAPNSQEVAGQSGCN